MAGIKRTVRKYGPVLGHRDGLHGERLLPYETARRLIYLPAYRWVLEHRAADLVERLRDLAGRQDVMLLDYTTNGDVTDPSSPLSHADRPGAHPAVALDACPPGPSCTPGQGPRPARRVPGAAC